MSLQPGNCRRPGDPSQSDHQQAYPEQHSTPFTGKEFVRGFVQHVLPPGFHKIRYYGWQHPRRKIDMDEVRWLACVATGLFFLLRFAPVEQPEELPPLRCVHCGGDLKRLGVTFRNCALLVTYCQSFYDSG